MTSLDASKNNFWAGQTIFQSNTLEKILGRAYYCCYPSISSIVGCFANIQQSHPLE
ncbi:hypothetical protein PENSUB_2048 [Penicillium subrubescens]|uniref:Uncharacterized protein n=1 Tax=Penicillium subrubescens TaxID=1316194 RepID=A0A1Q5UIM6_9EURO|nr:hypothetical protein PENSUB_2048 [Penicillium subrubescens]